MTFSIERPTEVEMSSTLIPDLLSILTTFCNIWFCSSIFWSYSSIFLSRSSIFLSRSLIFLSRNMMAVSRFSIAEKYSSSTFISWRNFESEAAVRRWRIWKHPGCLPVPRFRYSHTLYDVRIPPARLCCRHDAQEDRPKPWELHICEDVAHNGWRKSQPSRQREQIGRASCRERVCVIV